MEKNKDLKITSFNFPEPNWLAGKDIFERMIDEKRKQETSREKNSSEDVIKDDFIVQLPMAERVGTAAFSIKIPKSNVTVSTDESVSETSVDKAADVNRNTNSRANGIMDIISRFGNRARAYFESIMLYDTLSVDILERGVFREKFYKILGDAAYNATMILLGLKPDPNSPETSDRTPPSSADESGSPETWRFLEWVGSNPSNQLSVKELIENYRNEGNDTAIDESWVSIFMDRVSRKMRLTAVGSIRLTSVLTNLIGAAETTKTEKDGVAMNEDSFGNISMDKTSNIKETVDVEISDFDSDEDEDEVYGFEAFRTSDEDDDGDDDYDCDDEVSDDDYADWDDSDYPDDDDDDDMDWDELCDELDDNYLTKITVSKDHVTVTGNDGREITFFVNIDSLELTDEDPYDTQDDPSYSRWLRHLMPSSVTVREEDPNSQDGFRVTNYTIATDVHASNEQITRFVEEHGVRTISFKQIDNYWENGEPLIVSYAISIPSKYEIDSASETEFLRKINYLFEKYVAGTPLSQEGLIISEIIPNMLEKHGCALKPAPAPQEVDITEYEELDDEMEVIGYGNEEETETSEIETEDFQESDSTTMEASDEFDFDAISRRVAEAYNNEDSNGVDEIDPNEGDGDPKYYKRIHRDRRGDRKRN